MAFPLLSTKLYLTPPRPNLVTRPRLLQILDEGLSQRKRLTLVSAPAGYGKSMLVAEWIFGRMKDEGGRMNDQPVDGLHPSKFAWLSLDENDNDPARFLAYLVAALQRVDERIGQGLQSMLGGPQLPPLEPSMTSVINDIAGVSPVPIPGRPSPGSIVLVLDDYHKVRLPFIHEAIQFLLDHQPPQFHLVLVTREDPPLQLPRMRVRGEITEIRAQDLRFTLEETGQLFNQVLKLQLADRWVRSLESRTEGWIAGLHLAGLSLQGRSDIQAFLEDFNGSHRYLIDYLMDEVLRLQTEETRQFLYRTSILEQFNARLCAAVSGFEDSQERLAQLEGSNLFLIPLDEHREWYRYHHLFGDFLRLGLGDRLQEQLHQRACAWLQVNGFTPEAIEHALAAKDYERAGQLIGRITDQFFGNGRIATLLGWIDALPDEFIQQNADLFSRRVWYSYFIGRIEEANRWVDGLDDEALGRMDPLSRGRIHSLKAWNANAREEDATVSLAQEALAAIGAADPILRATTLLPLGHAHRRRCEMAQAVQAYQEAYQAGNQLHAPLLAASSMNSLAVTLNEQGRRREALTLCEEARIEAVDGRGSPLPAADLIFIAESVLAYEADELEQAVQYALKGREASRRFLSGRIMGGEIERVLIRSYSRLGNYQAAQEEIREARQLGYHLRWIAPQTDALEAEMHLKAGDLEFARRWAERAGLCEELLRLPAREVSTLTYIRLLMAENRLPEAQLLLERLDKWAREGGLYARLISISILQSLVELDLGNRPSAWKHLEEAIRWAAPGGYIRRFLDEGEAAIRLVEDFQQAAPETGQFVSLLLDAYARHEAKPISDYREPKAASSRDQPSRTADLPEPLSEQELKVLRLLCAGLSNQEIAAELVIGLGTAKWHVHNVYSKLGVNSRTQAVGRAQELKIV